jgi:hypothetical protein
VPINTDTPTHTLSDVVPDQGNGMTNKSERYTYIHTYYYIVHPSPSPPNPPGLVVSPARGNKANLF